MECQICIKKYTQKLRRKHICQTCKNAACLTCIVSYLKLDILHPKCMFCNSKIYIILLSPILSFRCYSQLLRLDFNTRFTQEQNKLLPSNAKRLMAAPQVLPPSAVHTRNLLPKSVKVQGSPPSGGTNRRFAPVGAAEGGSRGASGSSSSHEIAASETPKISTVLFTHCPRCNGALSFETTISTFNKQKQSLICCKVCNICFCNECLEIKTPSHECTTQALEDISKVQKFKNCPSCNLLIDKTEGGCDQMFCVECKTVFSWSTGYIINSDVYKHNPHYYQWKRAQGEDLARNEMDNPKEGPFYILCENKYKGKPIKLIELSEYTGVPVWFFDKNAFILQFHKTTMDLLFFVINQLQEKDLFLEYLRNGYCNNNITLKQWRRVLKVFFYRIHQFDTIKKFLLEALDELYDLIIDHDEVDDWTIQKYCLTVSEKIDCVSYSR